MKRIAYIFGVFALITASAISCEKEAQVENTENAGQGKQEQLKPETPTLKTLTFKITDSNETKMLLAETGGRKHGAWESGDYIGYVSNNASKDTDKAEVTNPTTSPSFTVTPAHGLAAGDQICFWYPYQTNQNNPASVQLEIPAAQTQDATLGFDFDAMPMVAEPLTVTSAMVTAEHYDGSIQFANLGSLICFKVYSSIASYRSEKLVSVTFESDAPIAGEFSHNLESVSFASEASLTISGHAEKSVTTTLSAETALTSANNKDNAIDVYMVIAPGTYSGQFIVDTDKAHYIYTITNKEFIRSGLKTFGVNLNSSNANRVQEVFLPWYFAGGPKSGLTSTIGVSSKGLGGDYASSAYPYQVCFDSDDDYIQIKTDSPIGKVFVGCQAKSAGTSSIIVQESIDGTSFSTVQTLSISIAKDATTTLETTNTFSSESRYVRLLFDKTGTNVGIGHILIKSPSTPQSYYKLVVGTADFSAGQYVIGALRSTLATDKFYFAKDAISIDGSNTDWEVEESGLTVEETLGERMFAIEDLPASAAEFTFAGNNSDGFTISHGANYLYYTDVSTSRRLAFGASDQMWTVAPKSSPLIFGGVSLRAVTGGSGNYTVSEYSTTTGAIRGYSGTTQYRAIYLFKKVTE